MLMEGWGIRESSKLKVWRQHYLVLTSDSFTGYSDDTKIKEPQNCLFFLNLQGIISINLVEKDGKENVFVIETEKKEDQKIFFSVPTKYLALKWVYLLRLALKKCLTRKGKEIIIKKPLNLLLTNENENEGRYSICFCSISTAAYKFDLDQASTVACDVFKNFLQQHPKAAINIYLVDYTNSKTIELFTKKKPDDNRMQVRVANLVKLKDLQIPCWYIVNASNPKFSEGGSGTNEAIHEACRSIYTPSLQTLSRRKYSENADLSTAYPVNLPVGCPLREGQNVRTVIHVVGPNMNPKRPNYLGEDYIKGKEELRKCYTNVLKCFWEATGLGLEDKD